MQQLNSGIFVEQVPLGLYNGYVLVIGLMVTVSLTASQIKTKSLTK